jgi:hypothetical protein
MLTDTAIPSTAAHMGTSAGNDLNTIRLISEMFQPKMMAAAPHRRDIHHPDAEIDGNRPALTIVRLM